jgi:Iron-containing redox enzyme
MTLQPQTTRDIQARGTTLTPLSLRVEIDDVICRLIDSCPDAAQLSPEERRGIIARYAAVLEGNFIYWMTAAHLAVGSETARAIITDNLLEEVRDNHPGMLRRFAMAAHAVPSEIDVFDVHRNLQDVRLFVAGLDACGIVLMMAFFESFITRFMPYLADLATRQGSTEHEYTDVHGTVDIIHAQGLLQALDAEMALRANGFTVSLDGVDRLRALIEQIIRGHDDGTRLSDASVTAGAHA